MLQTAGRSYIQVYIVAEERMKDIIFIVSIQTKGELKHKVWLCLYQLKRNIEENAIYLTALIQS